MGHYGPLLHFAPHSVPFYPTGTFPVPDPNELKLTPPASIQGTFIALLYGIIACIRIGNPRYTHGFQIFGTYIEDKTFLIAAKKQQLWYGTTSGKQTDSPGKKHP